MVLEDGIYEAFVLDAAADGPVLRLEVTIVAGPHKGAVLSVRADGLDLDELECLGLPATLAVTGGDPSIELHR